MTKSDYVKVKDRVRVVDCPWPASELLLLMQSGDMRIEAGELRGPLEEKAVLIRKAMECFGVAVRERCVQEIRVRCFSCEATGFSGGPNGYIEGSTCAFCGPFIAAIRELEL